MYTKDNITGITFLALNREVKENDCVYIIKRIIDDHNAELLYYNYPNKDKNTSMDYGLRDILKNLNDGSCRIIGQNESITYQIY